MIFYSHKGADVFIDETRILTAVFLKDGSGRLETSGDFEVAEIRFEGYPEKVVFPFETDHDAKTARRKIFEAMEARMPNRER